MRGSGVEVGHGVSGGRRRCWCTGPLYGVSHHGCFTRFTHVAHLADSSANVINNTTTHVTAHGTTDVSAHVPTSVVTAPAARTTVSAATIPGVRGRVIVLSGVPLRYCQLFVLDGQTLYLETGKGSICDSKRFGECGEENTNVNIRRLVLRQEIIYNII